MSTPSFSSFPPSFLTFPDLESVSNPDPGNKILSSKEDRRHEKKKRGESSSDHHRNREEKKDRKRRKERSGSPHGNGHFPLREGGSPLQRDNNSRHSDYDRLFYSDRRGDPLNVQYGGLHTGDIPRYHFVNNTRNVLGLPQSFTIYHRMGKGIEIGPKSFRKMSSLTDSGSRALLKRAPERRLAPSAASSKYKEEEGIIYLPSRKGPRKPEDSYRSITGQENASDSDISSLPEDEVSNSDEGDGDLVLTAHQEILKSLEQDLASHPSDVEKWLALLHQTLSTIPLASKNATQARSEITISILSRALSADPLNTKNKMLSIFYLKAGEDVWHESKLKAEWETAFKEGDTELVMEWLEWQIRKGKGGLDALMAVGVKALERFATSEDDTAKVRAFWRIAFALRSAGYPERAMAMFQAQSELMFCIPPVVSEMSFQVQLDEFEEFWESEVPRTGEDGSKGWMLWYLSKSDQSPPAMQPFPPVPPDLDPYREWARRETFFDSKAVLPFRSDADTHDPYSTVLFSDIRSMMLDVRSNCAREDFRLAWLSFLGLCVPGFRLAPSPDLDWDDRWKMEFLTRPTNLNSIFPSDDSQDKLLTDSVAGVVIGREREYSSPFGSVRSWGRGVLDALDLASAEPGRIQRRGLWSSKDLADIDENVVRRIFMSLRLGKEDFEWDSLMLAFELAANPKNAAKVSKTLLSTNQDSLALWGAHAQLERLRGRLDDARKVYQTILIASSPSNTQHVLGRLWWNWAEMEWLAGDERQTLNIILRSVHLEGSGSGVTLLRAKRLLEDFVATEDVTNWKEREAWIRLRALLELLIGHQPTSALSIFDKYLPIEGRGAFNESLTTSALLMLYYYGTILRNPMPPTILRERAYAAYEAYPSNSIVLGTLLEAEKGQSVWGRLRAMFGGGDVKAKDVVRRIEEVWVASWEKGRWHAELERTRSGLAAAVEHERTRSSPIIWRIYIEFEIRVGELHRAKKLLFRAVGECPMVKGIYLLAFGPLRSVFASHELNALADTMAERGLRLHYGLDEVLPDGMDMIENREQENQNNSEDEIEHNAKELRRLRPY